MTKTILLLTVLALAGCATSQEAKVFPDPAVQFHVGTTTYNDVVSALGTPDRVILNEDGSKTAYYSAIPKQPPVDAPVTRVLGGADTDATKAVMMFDRAGVLTTAFYNQWGTEAAMPG